MLPDEWPKLGVVGEVTVSFSSSSATRCMALVSSLEEPKGFAFAPKGLVKPGLDMSDSLSRKPLLWCQVVRARQLLYLAALGSWVIK
jgi:hypothetical protein